MTPLMIVQLLTQFGPAALGLIRDLAEVWSKPELTPDEVKAFCDRSRKSYEQYIAEAKQP
jgi:hypothetical protein